MRQGTEKVFLEGDTAGSEATGSSRPVSSLAGVRLPQGWCPAAKGFAARVSCSNSLG